MRAFSLIELMVVLAIVGLLASLAVQRQRAVTCRAAKSEALIAMGAVAALEETTRAEHDVYKTVAAKCGAKSKTCMTYTSKGEKARFTVIAEVTKAGYTITATGIAGSSMKGGIWQMDQNRRITDVTGLCR